MALTRPTFEQTLTTKVEITDPVMLINKDSPTNRDLGLIIDRSYLAQSNIAIVFKHTDQTLHFITTDDSGDLSGSFGTNTKVDISTGNITGSNISVGNITGANVNVGNITSADINAANISGNYFIGNGSLLTGTIGSAIVAETVSANSQPNITAVGILSSLSLGGQVTGNIIPSSNILYNLGSSTNRFKDIWLANSTIYLGNVSLSATDTNLSINGIDVQPLYTLSDINAANVSGQVANALVAGTVYTNSQPNITSVGTLTSLTVDGNVSAGNLSGTKITATTLEGTLSAAAQPNVTSLGTLVSLEVAGNIIAGNLSGNLITGTLTTAAQPNITSLGNLDSLTVVGNLGAGNISATSIAGTLTTSSQPNITALGTLDSLSVTGNITSGNLSATAISGTLSTPNQPNITDLGTLNSLAVTGNLSAGNISATGISGTLATSSQPNITSVGVLNSLTVNGNVSAQGISGTLTTSSQPNITAVGTLDSLNVSGNLAAGNISATSISGALTTASQPNITEVGTLDSLDVSGNVSAGNISALGISGTLSTASQTNITAVGTLGSLDVSGNISAGNISATGISGTLSTSSQPNITAVGSLEELSVIGAITASSISANGSLLSQITAANINGQVANALVAGTVYTNSQPNITSLGTLTDLTVSGTSSFTDVNISGKTTVSNTTQATGVGTGAFTILGGASVSKDLFVGGSVYTPNLVALDTYTLSVQDPLLYLTANTPYPYNYDIGVFSHFIGGPSNVYSHTGIVRSYLDEHWYLFSNAPEPEGGTVDFANASLIYDSLKLANLIANGNVISQNASLGNLVTANYFSGNGSFLSSVTGANVVGQVANALVSGTVYTNAQPNITSVGTLISLSVTGNLSAGNVSATELSGTLSTAAQPNITSVGTLSSLAVTGNITAGNVSATGLAGTLSTAAQPNITSVGTLNSLVVTGNITSSTGNFIGNGALLTGLPAGYSDANVASYLPTYSGNIGGTLTTASQPYVTSLGSLISLNVTGNVSAGNVSGTLITGTLTTATQPNITSVGTLTSLAVTGNISAGNVSAAGLAGTLSTAAQPNITSVGTLASLNVTGNITISSGNFIGNGALLTGLPSGYSNSNVASYLPIYSGNLGGTLTTAAQPFVTSLGTLTSLAVTGNVSAGNLSGTLVTGTLTTAAQPNITSVGTLSSLTVTANVTAAAASYTGNVSVGNLLLTGNIVDTAALGINSGSNGNITLNAGSGSIVLNSGVLNGQANGVGNIGSSTSFFNTVFAKATSAQYADLAEIYLADDEYEPGTVVIFGGEKEITVTNVGHDSRVAGVISTAPAYLMNSGAKGLPVALTGRVPCKVIGPVQKGTVLTTSTIPGVAEALMRPLYQPGCVIGKSLEDVPLGETKIIEVVVGRF